MKICLFDDYRPGRVDGDTIIDLSTAVGTQVMEEAPQERIFALIERFESLRPAVESATGPSLSLSSVRLRAPVPRPNKMIFGQGNYMENTDTPIIPLNMFLKLPSTVLDPGGTVELIRDDAVIFQHEAELAVIIGRGGKHISQEQALDHVFGYSSLIDVSARGLGRGLDLSDKSPDTFCPFGPWITTADAISDPQTLQVRLWVDDALRQDYNTDDMEHPVAALVAWASRVVTLEPGDVIACGTNHQGLGPLQDGETARIEIEGIGPMSVRIADPLHRRWPVGIDPGVGRAAVKMRTTGQIPPASEVFQVRRIA